MAEVSNANNSKNVSAGKGVKGGYIFSAPVGTTLPDKVIKNKSELDPAFKCLGFVSEDGYVESVSEDSNDTVDMNGDGNVTDEGGLITVKHNSDSHPTFAYVLLLLLKNGRKWTKVVPRGQSSELDDLTISSSELCQRALTMKYLTDEDGNTCYDYIESTETAAA